MTTQNIDVAGGKYTVVFDEDTGKLSALRHGEPWRDLTGDKLIYWLMVEVQSAKEQLVKVLWNSHADMYNQWEELGQDEKNHLISEVKL